MGWTTPSVELSSIFSGPYNCGLKFVHSTDNLNIQLQLHINTILNLNAQKQCFKLYFPNSYRHQCAFSSYLPNNRVTMIAKILIKRRIDASRTFEKRSRYSVKKKRRITIQFEPFLVDIMARLAYTGDCEMELTTTLTKKKKKNHSFTYRPLRSNIFRNPSRRRSFRFRPADNRNARRTRSLCLCISRLYSENFYPKTSRRLWTDQCSGHLCTFDKTSKIILPVSVNYGRDSFE